MKILRVLNKNTVISANQTGDEVLVMGAGIAFSKKKGEDIDLLKVEKIFYLSDQKAMSRFSEIASDVPMQVTLIAEKIINYAKIKLGKKLSELIYVNLTDHINSALERHSENIELKNSLKWDVARLYRDEYDVGKKAVDIIRRELGVSFGDDEAAFIALHFVNILTGSESGDAYGITEIVSQAEAIVKKFFNTELDEGSLDYYRFITHLKFFAQRTLEGKHYDDAEDAEILRSVEAKYLSSMECARKISDFTSSQYHFRLSSTEILYLTIHINRIVKNL